MYVIGFSFNIHLKFSGIVSNEYVEIAKDFIPDDKSYKFVNKIIDNIGKEYDEFKKKKN